MERAMDAVQRGRVAAQTRAAALERELTSLAVSERQETAAVEYAANVAAGLDALDDAGRQRLLRDLVAEVRVDGRNVLIHTGLPTGDRGPSGDGRSGQLDSRHFRPVVQGGAGGRPSLRLRRESQGGHWRALTLSPPVGYGCARSSSSYLRNRKSPGSPISRGMAPCAPATATHSLSRSRSMTVRRVPAATPSRATSRRTSPFRRSRKTVR